MIEPWEHILREIKYVNQNEIEVTATTIKNCKKTWTGDSNQFEPRLLAYHTSFQSRPPIFKEKGLFILPIKNGEYLLQKTNIYQSLHYEELRHIAIERDTTSLVLKIGESETTTIDNLRYSGVFERPEILGEPITHGPLLNGRHRLSADIKIGGLSRKIQGVQYEVDSCFETKNKVIIIEGKSDTKQIHSFNIRQLYFPFRSIHAIVGDKKEILCAFIHKLGKHLHIWLYTFDDPMEFLSIREKGHFVYIFNS